MREISSIIIGIVYQWTEIFEVPKYKFQVCKVYQFRVFTLQNEEDEEKMY